MSDISLKVTSDSSQARADLGKLTNSVNTLEQRTSETATNLIALGKNLAAVIASSAAVNYFSRLADSTTNLQNKLRLVNSELTDLSLIQTDLREISRRTRSELNATGDVYFRLASALRNSGKANAEFLRTTELIQKAVALSSTSAESAAAGLFQFGQGLAANALRGQELNSVIEQIPALAQNIAQGLNVSLGGLRKLAEEGALTADVVLGAISRQANQINSDFDKLVPSISQSFVLLNSAFRQLLGTFLQYSRFGSGFSSVLNSLANTFISANQRIIETFEELEYIYTFVAKPAFTAIGGLFAAIGNEVLKALPVIRTFQVPLSSLIGLLSIAPRQTVFETLFLPIRQFSDDVRGVFELLTAFTISDTRFGRELSDLFEVKSLDEFIQRIDRLRALISGEEVSPFSVLGPVVFAFDQVEAVLTSVVRPVQNVLASVGLIENRLFEVLLVRNDRVRAVINLLGQSLSFFFDRVIYPLLAQLEIAIEGVSVALTNAIASFAGFANAVTRPLRVVTSTLTTSLLSIRTLFLDAFGGSNIRLDALRNISDVFSDIANAVSEQVKNLVNSVEDLESLVFGRDFTRSFSKFISKVLTVFLVPTDVSTIDEIREVYEKVFNSLGKTGEVLRKVFENVVRFFRDSLEFISVKLDDTSGVIDDFSFGLLRTPLENIIKFKNRVLSSFLEIYDKVVGNSYWPDTILEILEYTDLLLFNGTDLFSEFRDIVLDIFEDIYNQIPERLKGIVSAATGTFLETTLIGQNINKLFTVDPEVAAKSIVGGLGLAIGLFLLDTKNVVLGAVKSIFGLGGAAAALAFIQSLEKELDISIIKDAGKFFAQFVSQVLISSIPVVADAFLEFAFGALQAVIESIPLVGSLLSSVLGFERDGILANILFGFGVPFLIAKLVGASKTIKGIIEGLALSVINVQERAGLRGREGLLATLLGARFTRDTGRKFKLNIDTTAFASTFATLLFTLQGFNNGIFGIIGGLIGVISSLPRTIQVKMTAAARAFTSTFFPSLDKTINRSTDKVFGFRELITTVFGSISRFVSQAFRNLFSGESLDTVKGRFNTLFQELKTEAQDAVKRFRTSGTKSGIIYSAIFDIDDSEEGKRKRKLDGIFNADRQRVLNSGLETQKQVKETNEKVRQGANEYVNILENQAKQTTRLRDRINVNLANSVERPLRKQRQELVRSGRALQRYQSILSGVSAVGLTGLAGLQFLPSGEDLTGTLAESTFSIRKFIDDNFAYLLLGLSALQSKLVQTIAINLLRSPITAVIGAGGLLALYMFGEGNTLSDKFDNFIKKITSFLPQIGTSFRSELQSLLPPLFVGRIEYDFTGQINALDISGLSSEQKTAIKSLAKDLSTELAKARKEQLEFGQATDETIKRVDLLAKRFSRKLGNRNLQVDIDSVAKSIDRLNESVRRLTQQDLSRNLTQGLVGGLTQGLPETLRLFGQFGPQAGTFIQSILFNLVNGFSAVNNEISTFIQSQALQELGSTFIRLNDILSESRRNLELLVPDEIVETDTLVKNIRNAEERITGFVAVLAQAETFLSTVGLDVNLGGLERYQVLGDAVTALDKYNESLRTTLEFRRELKAYRDEIKALETALTTASITFDKEAINLLSSQDTQRLTRIAQEVTAARETLARKDFTPRGTLDLSAREDIELQAAGALNQIRIGLSESQIILDGLTAFSDRLTRAINDAGLEISIEAAPVELNVSDQFADELRKVDREIARIEGRLKADVGNFAGSVNDTLSDLNQLAQQRVNRFNLIINAIGDPIQRIQALAKRNQITLDERQLAFLGPISDDVEKKLREVTTLGIQLASTKDPERRNAIRKLIQNIRQEITDETQFAGKTSLNVFETIVAASGESVDQNLFSRASENARKTLYGLYNEAFNITKEINKVIVEGAGDASAFESVTTKVADLYEKRRQIAIKTYQDVVGIEQKFNDITSGTSVQGFDRNVFLSTVSSEDEKNLLRINQSLFNIRETNKGLLNDTVTYKKNLQTINQLEASRDKILSKFLGKSVEIDSLLSVSNAKNLIDFNKFFDVQTQERFKQLNKELLDEQIRYNLLKDKNLLTNEDIEASLTKQAILENKLNQEAKNRIATLKELPDLLSSIGISGVNSTKDLLAFSNKGILDFAKEYAKLRNTIDSEPIDLIREEDLNKLQIIESRIERVKNLLEDQREITNSTLDSTREQLSSFLRGKGFSIESVLNSVTGTITDTFANRLNDFLFKGVANFLGESISVGIDSLFGGERGSSVANPMFVRVVNDILGGAGNLSNIPNIPPVGMIRGPSGGFIPKIDPFEVDGQAPGTSISDVFTTFTKDLGNILSGDSPFLKGFGDLFSNLGSNISGLFSGGGGGIFDAIGSAFTSFRGFLGFADGGVIPSNPTGAMPVIAHAGEIILNEAQQARVAAAMQNGSGGQQVVNVNITGDISRQTKSEIYKMLPSIAEGVNSHNREKGYR